MSKKVFVAGASGVIGVPLCKMLLDAGYEVFGTTRSKEKAKTLEALGVSPVVLDVYDYATLEKNSFRDKTRACLSSTYRLARWLRRREDERCT